MRSCTSAAGATLIDKVKSPSGYRTIRLPELAVTLLRRQRASVAELKLAARTWSTDPRELCFPTVQGTPWDPANGRDEFYGIQRRLGIRHTVPHELRHTTGSLLSAAGVPWEMIADLLGHSSIHLRSVYRHRPDTVVTVAADHMDRILGGP